MIMRILQLMLTSHLTNLDDEFQILSDTKNAIQTRIISDDKRY